MLTSTPSVAFMYGSTEKKNLWSKKLHCWIKLPQQKWYYFLCCKQSGWCLKNFQGNVEVPGCSFARKAILKNASRFKLLCFKLVTRLWQSSIFLNVKILNLQKITGFNSFVCIADLPLQSKTLWSKVHFSCSLEKWTGFTCVHWI